MYHSNHKINFKKCINVAIRTSRDLLKPVSNHRIQPAPNRYGIRIQVADFSFYTKNRVYYSASLQISISQPHYHHPAYLHARQMTICDWHLSSQSSTNRDNMSDCDWDRYTCCAIVYYKVDKKHWLFTSDTRPRWHVHCLITPCRCRQQWHRFLVQSGWRPARPLRSILRWPVSRIRRQQRINKLQRFIWHRFTPLARFFPLSQLLFMLLFSPPARGVLCHRLLPFDGGRALAARAPRVRAIPFVPTQRFVHAVILAPGAGRSCSFGIRLLLTRHRLRVLPIYMRAEKPRRATVYF